MTCCPELPDTKTTMREGNRPLSSSQEGGDVSRRNKRRRCVQSHAAPDLHRAKEKTLPRPPGNTVGGCNTNDATRKAARAGKNSEKGESEFAVVRWVSTERRSKSRVKCVGRAEVKRKATERFQPQQDTEGSKTGNEDSENSTFGARRGEKTRRRPVRTGSVGEETEREKGPLRYLLRLSRGTPAGGSRRGHTRGDVFSSHHAGYGCYRKHEGLDVKGVSVGLKKGF